MVWNESTNFTISSSCHLQEIERERERERERECQVVLLVCIINDTIVSTIPTCTPSSVLLFRCTIVTFSRSSLPSTTLDTDLEFDVLPVVMMITPAPFWILTSIAGGSKQLNKFTSTVAFSKPNDDSRQLEVVQFCVIEHGGVLLVCLDCDNNGITSQVVSSGECV